MPIDYKHYPEDWPEIRKRILERDSHCCKQCGVKNYSVGNWTKDGHFLVQEKCESFENAKTLKECLNKEYLPHIKHIIIILTIAHLDHDEWNHDVKDDRLAALCQRCHLKYDRIDNDNRKKYGKYYRRFQNQIL